MARDTMYKRDVPKKVDQQSGFELKINYDSKPEPLMTNEQERGKIPIYPAMIPTHRGHMPNFNYPVQQKYNIMMPGPDQLGHKGTSKIFDDILPFDNPLIIFITLGYRFKLYEYIRSRLIRSNEGERIRFDDKIGHNILSYIRLMDINPFAYGSLSANPYKSLPYGMLLYRCGYPINVVRSFAQVAKNAVGLNMRIYSLSIGEYMSYAGKSPVYREYDVWRELRLYEYIRNHILKKKISPHFAMMYTYFLAENHTIDYFKMRKQYLTPDQRIIGEFEAYVTAHMSKDYVDAMVANKQLSDLLPTRFKLRIPDHIDPRMRLYSGNCLLILTEAPTYNIYSWTSRIYKGDDEVQQLYSHGFHGSEEWMVLIFQIAAALHVMQKHGLYIREMTMADHVYVKELDTEGPTGGYWQYNLDGIDYYIPNLGFMILIDSNFKDIDLDRGNNYPSFRQKICFDGMYPDKKYDSKKIDDHILLNAAEILNPNSFTNDREMINPPSDAIKLLLGAINTDLKQPGTKKISDVIAKHFIQYVHNKAGTRLDDQTDVNIIIAADLKFKPGELVVYMSSSGTYYWAVLVKHEAPNITIIGKDRDDENLRYISTTIAQVAKYNHSSPLAQDAGPDGRFIVENRLELYTS